MAIKDIKNWVIGADVDEENFDNNTQEEFSTQSSTYEEPIASSFETSADTNFGVTSTSSFEDTTGKGAQMVVFEPRSYSESQGIADHLKSKRGCIINLHRVSKDQAKRIIDFLSGVVYAIEGEVQKIGPNVFLCTPNNFAVHGEITDTEE
ncbi:cell division protein SepF [Mycoplasma sp. P36-A1]|uniref:cell division protein SepF n=1 Tax=Mycoplasma sp. P36-A1 TaxID=3252900 RepID=UPI003C3014C8